jgi:hypothetical protein
VASFHEFLEDWRPLAEWGVAAGTFALAAVTYVLARGAKGEVRESRRSSDRVTTMTVLREYSSPSLRAARKAVHALPAITPENGWDGLTSSGREAAEEVSNYLDAIGFLLNRELLEPHAFAAFMGGSVNNMWRVLGPYIYDYRERHNVPTYQRYFEHLAAVMQELALEDEIAKLKFLPPEVAARDEMPAGSSADAAPAV